MRILLLGGTFNPVHWGHLVLAEELREEFAYDRVLLVPAARPPHKEALGDPGAAERLEMLRLACADNPAFSVEPCELERPGLSYTVDTVRGLPARYAIEGKPGLALGDDLVAGFPSWREPEALAGLADLVVARRSGLPFDLPYPHRKASNRLIPLSSSEIRGRLAAGKSVRYLVPEAVRAYILEKGLYGSR